MNRDSLPRWAWLLIALVLASSVSQLVNVAVLFPLGLPDDYGVVTNVAAMAPVLVYIGLWYDEDKRSYWDRSRLRLAGDVLFVVAGAAIGAAVVAVAVGDAVSGQLLRDMPALLGGFAAAYALFWWRCPEYVGPPSADG